jgi:Aminotransferase class I and II
MNLQGARTIPDPVHQEIMQKYDPVKDLYDADLVKDFGTEFFSWITHNKQNQYQGLHRFNHITLCAGSSQAFDHFYLKHHKRRFRTLPGEFMYHRAVLKQGFHHLLLTSDALAANDAVIISVPFSDTGKRPDKLEEILSACDEKQVPVLLDMAYAVCSKNIHVDLDHTCIDAVVFSMSKFLHGAEHLRVGIRFQRRNDDDGIDVFNSVGMNNRQDIGLARHIMRYFPSDYLWSNYAKQYAQAIKKLKLKATDCIMFGLDYRNQYPELNRGNEFNRVCISEMIADACKPGK